MKLKKAGLIKSTSATRPKSRILLANENALSTRLLARALEQNSRFQVIEYAGDSDGLVQAVRERDPDLLLLGGRMLEPTAAGFPRLKPVIDAFPSVPCVVLLDRSDRASVVDAFRAGVKGVFLCSQANVESLKKCIQRVLEGQIWADTSQLHYIISALPSLRAHEDGMKAREFPRLTAREEQVARYVSDGMGNREIASQMNLRENTIKNYIFRIYEKLGLSNRVELARYAMKTQDDFRSPQNGEPKDQEIVLVPDHSDSIKETV